MEHYAGFFEGCSSEQTDSTIGIKDKATSYFDPQNCNRAFQLFYRIYPSWDSLAIGTGLGNFVHSSHH